uniref:Sulfatase domain-containing protein n=1 Tax=Strongyloides papillosus TaxID=174720 RepID=A0A0N5BCL9_STREA
MDNMCQIPKFNIWDKSISRYITKKYKNKKCVKTYENNYYTLNNGLLKLNSSTLENSTCFYACIYPIGDNSLTKGKYEKIVNPVILDCDTFHIYCRKPNITIFEDLNFHIRSINFNNQVSSNVSKINQNFVESSKKYNVHIFVIDSLSYYQAKRGFEKSRNLFREKYQSIEFPFLNRVADNSRPNAYSFLMNKNSLNIIDIFGTKRTIINDWKNDDPCNVPLNDTTYIINQYKKMGYITMNAENYWYGGVFNWNNCKSFTKQQADHTLRTFQLANRVISYKLVDRITRERCFGHGNYLFEYLKQFSERYKDKPHLSLVWESNAVHNDINGIMDFDNYFENFFSENINLFKNSFMFVMSDHGFRLGSFQDTQIGKFEADNPYLMISVPIELRNNKQLLKTLKENSNKHISHFDVYATLLDILTEASKTNFENLKEFDLSSIVNFKVKGKSMLRPLQIKNRSCYELYVPLENCLCQFNFTKKYFISNKEQNSLKYAFLDEINKNIINNNLTNICAKRSLNNNYKFNIGKAYLKNETPVYEVKGHVLPGDGIFSGFFNGDFQLINNELLRINSYRSESESCLYEGKNSKYCFCKKLIKQD